MCISILSLCLRCIVLPLIILEMFQQLNWSPPVVNSVDWMWFGKAHTPVYVRSQGWRCMSKHRPSMKTKGLYIDFWDRIVSRHKAGRLQKTFCCFEGSNEQEWQKFGTTRSDQGRRNWKTSQVRGKEEGSSVQRHPGWKPALLTSDWDDGSSFSRTMTLSTRPRYWRSGFRTERSENGCSLTLPIQPGGVWEVLQRGLGPKIGVPSLWHYIQNDLRL